MPLACRRRPLYFQRLHRVCVYSQHRLAHGVRIDRGRPFSHRTGGRKIAMLVSLARARDEARSIWTCAHPGIGVGPCLERLMCMCSQLLIVSVIIPSACRSNVAHVPLTSWSHSTQALLARRSDHAHKYRNDHGSDDRQCSGTGADLIILSWRVVVWPQRPGHEWRSVQSLVRQTRGPFGCMHRGVFSSSRVLGDFQRPQELVGRVS